MRLPNWRVICLSILLSITCGSQPTRAQSLASTASSDASLTCWSNLSEFIAPIVIDHQSNSNDTIITCNQPLAGAVLQLTYISDPTIPISLSSSVIRDGVFDLGFDLGSLAHTGLNVVEADIQVGGQRSSFRFEFIRDLSPPVTTLSAISGGYRVEALESYSEIRSMFLTKRIGSGQSFLAVNMLDNPAVTAIGSQTSKQKTLQFPLSLAGTEFVIEVEDRSGNVGEVYFGPGSIENFRVELENYFEAQRAAEVAEFQSQNPVTMYGQGYGLRLALVVMVPQSYQSAQVLERMLLLKQEAEKAITLLDQEFVLNNRPVPGFVENSIKNLRYYVRFQGDSEARQVSNRSLGVNRLDYIWVVRNLPAIPAVDYEIKQIGGVDKYFIKSDPNSHLAMGEKIIRDIFSTPQTGAERVIVFCDGFDPADKLGIFSYEEGARSMAVQLPIDKRKYKVDSAEVIIHELGHSVNVDHVNTNRYPHFTGFGIYDTGANDRLSYSYMNGTGVDNSLPHYLTFSQVVLYQQMLFGSPAQIAQQPLNQTPETRYWGGHFETKPGIKEGLLQGTEQFNGRAFTPVGLFDREAFPPVAAVSGDLPPFYLAQPLTVSNEENLPSPNFPAILYNFGDPQLVKVLVPAGIDPSTGRYELLQDGTPGEREDFFSITPGTKVIHIGAIPLGGNTIFGPFHRAQENERLLPESDPDWNNLTGRGVAFVEIPVPEGVSPPILRVRSRKEVSGNSGPPLFRVDIEAPNTRRMIRYGMEFEGGNEALRRLIPFALVIYSDELSPLTGQFYNAPLN